MKPFPFETENFLGNRLRLLRLKMDISQAIVAKMLNVSRSTYSYYELGATRPDPITLAKLSAWYDVPIEIFFLSDSEIDDVLSDPIEKKQRTTKTWKEKFDPEKVGTLRPKERELIMLLRSNGVLDAEDVLDYLESRLSDLEKEQK